MLRQQQQLPLANFARWRNQLAIWSWTVIVMSFVMSSVHRFATPGMDLPPIHQAMAGAAETTTTAINDTWIEQEITGHHSLVKCSAHKCNLQTAKGGLKQVGSQLIALVTSGVIRRLWLHSVPHHVVAPLVAQGHKVHLYMSINMDMGATGLSGSVSLIDPILHNMTSTQACGVIRTMYEAAGAQIMLLECVDRPPRLSDVQMKYVNSSGHFGMRLGIQRHWSVWDRLWKAAEEHERSPNLRPAKYTLVWYMKDDTAFYKPFDLNRMLVAIGVNASNPTPFIVTVYCPFFGPGAGHLNDNTVILDRRAISALDTFYLEMIAKAPGTVETILWAASAASSKKIGTNIWKVPHHYIPMYRVMRVKSARTSPCITTRCEATARKARQCGNKRIIQSCICTPKGRQWTEDELLFSSTLLSQFFVSPTSCNQTLLKLRSPTPPRMCRR